MTTNWAAKTGAVFYALWGAVHVAGAGVQLATLHGEGPNGLARLIASATPYDAAAQPVPEVAGRFMGMGAFNILWIGVLVLVVAVTMNWRNRPLGYWLNLGVVGATDFGLLWFLLASGTMAWTDGGIGLSLFVVALIFATVGYRKAGTLSPA